MAEAPWNSVFRYRGALEELASTWPHDVDYQRLWWDSYHRVLVTRAATLTMHALYGNGIARWGRHALGAIRNLKQRKRLRRWEDPHADAFALPSDAVLIPIRQGLLIASAESERILKIDYGERRPTLKQEIQKSIDVWNLATQAEIEDHVPALIDYGSTQDGGDWALKQLALNTRPFLCKQNARPFDVWFRSVWHQWLRHEILPVMERFYDASGVRLRDAEHVLATEKEALRLPDSPKPFRKLVEMAENAQPIRSNTNMARAMIHGDLMPYHVHRDGISWKLIDWEMAHRKEVFWELFGKYLWHPHVKQKENQAFWAWLRSEVEISQMPWVLRKEIHLFMEWQKRWKGLSADTRTLRYQMLAILLKEMRKKAEKHDFMHLLHDLDSDRALQGHTNFWVQRTTQQLKALGITH